MKIYTLLVFSGKNIGTEKVGGYRTIAPRAQNQLQEKYGVDYVLALRPGELSAFARYDNGPSWKPGFRRVTLS